MKSHKKIRECQPNQCFLCKNVDPSRFHHLSEVHDVKRYRKGQFVFEEGEPILGVYFLLEGKVKIDTKWGDKRLILRLAGPGDIVGYRGIDQNWKNNSYHVNAIALEESHICFVPITEYLKLLHDNKNFLFEMMLFYSNELNASEERMKNLAHMPVKGRVAQALLTINKVYGTDEEGKLAYKMSRKDMAAMAGSTYESVIRMLNELVKDGYIKMKSKEITILDVDHLIACCRNHALENS
ncbi:MAG: helix-turn-helix domain-containing protein [Bacteroidetes bacterium]|nr:helix-turn-helix domain-containing protein [Bacteroidota bacterium]